MVRRIASLKEYNSMAITFDVFDLDFFAGYHDQATCIDFDADQLGLSTMGLFKS